MYRMTHTDDEESNDFPAAYADEEECGDEPVYKCKNCSDKNSGYEEKEASIVTLIAVIFSLLVFQLYALLLLPLVIESTRTITKKCAKCNHVLDKQELLSVPSLTDKVLNFKCGGCAVVISRKYTLILIAILSVVWFLIPSRNASINPGGITLDNLTWQDFIHDCGKEVILNNQVRAKKNFEEKYAGNIIEWQGIVQQVFLKERIKDDDISAVIRIKMNPTETDQEYADIQLTFLENLGGSKYKDTIKELAQGDVIKFKAIMLTMSDEMHHNNFEAIGIVKTGERMDIGMIPIVGYLGNVDETIDKGHDSMGDEVVNDDEKGSADQVTDTDDDNKSGNDDKIDSQQNSQEPENCHKSKKKESRKNMEM